MKCFHPMCDKRAPMDTLFRVNAKGVPGIWACRAHLKNTDARIDPLVDQVVSTIERGSQRR